MKEIETRSMPAIPATDFRTDEAVAHQAAAQPVKSAAVVVKAPLAGSTPSPEGVALPLPHERDESAESSAAAPDPVMQQAKRDIDAGNVDTDMRATPGLDAKRRGELVPGAGGKAAGKAE
jgi:hypothetical protein